MKKFFVLALAAAVGVLVLTGCGQSGKTAYSTALVERIAQAAFALYKLGDYGLTEEDLTDCAVLRSAGATCEEGAVLVLSDQDKASQAEKAVKAYVDSQIAANESYRPAEIPKLEQALVEQRENSVLLVVANDLDAAKGAID